MIIHLLVPGAQEQSVRDEECKDFRIINIFHKNRFGNVLFIVETTEEQLTYYTLKYGRDNAWER